jgi:hypothetical protein
MKPFCCISFPANFTELSRTVQAQLLFAPFPSSWAVS